MASRRKQRALLELLELRQLLSSYFVAPNGDDNAAGTADAPWATLQKAALTVVAGDDVTVRAGNYVGFVMGWDIINSGTPEARIVWNADPGVNIISRDNKTPDGIDLEGVSYITINGFVVNNSWGAGGIDRAGIRAVNSSGITITNCTTVDNGTWGIYTSHSDYVVIDHNLSADNNAIDPDYWNHHGIYVSNSAISPIVRNNVVYGNHGNGIHFNGDASQGGSGVVTNALVENNIIYDNGLDGGSGINMDGVVDSLVRNNLLFNNHAKGIALYQIDAGAPSTGNTVVNNTIYMASGAQYAITIKDGSINNHILNNILQNNDSKSGAINIDEESLPGLVSNYNAVIGRFSIDDGESHMGLSEWEAFSGQDLQSFLSSPTDLFVDVPNNNFHLNPTSPAIDSGTTTSAPATDLEGNFRPAGLGIDVGAFEYGAVGTPGIPKTPSNLVAVSNSSTTAELLWGDKSNNENGFRVERAVNGGVFQPVAWLNPNVTLYLDTGLLPSTNYTYRVIALNTWGDSPASNRGPVTTLAVTAPTTLVALPASYSSIQLTWQDADAGYVNHYNVYRSTTATVPLDAAHQIGTSSTLSFVDPTVTPGPRYYYRVTAVSGGQVESTPSNYDDAATIPAAPIQVQASTVASNRIEITWNVQDWSDIDHFNVYRSTSPIFTSAIPIDQPTGAITDDAAIVPGKTYYYYVTAVNIAGVESGRSSMVLASIVPAAPTSLMTTADNYGIQLSWAYDPRATIDHFNVYRNDSPSIPLDAAHLVSDATSTEYTDTSVDGRTWYYEVTAVNAAGIESGVSNESAAQLATGFARLDGTGALYITGGNGNDLVQVSQAGSSVQVSLNGTSISYPKAEVQSIVVNSLAGDDTLFANDLGTVGVSFTAGAGANTLYVNSGTLTLNSDPGQQNHVAIQVASGAGVLFHTSQHLASLSIADGGTATMLAPANSYLCTQGISISGSGVLDLNDSDLLVDYSGASPFAAIRSYVETGYGAGTAARGISSSAQDAQNGSTTLSVLDNTMLALTTWDGQTIDSTTVIGKYTLMGDANLDGVVNSLDDAVVLRNLGRVVQASWQGDINLDGIVTTDDLSTIDANFGMALVNAGSTPATQAIASMMSDPLITAQGLTAAVISTDPAAGSTVSAATDSLNEPAVFTISDTTTHRHYHRRHKRAADFL